ncbi:MAG TPA: N-acetylmuramoyl-L-alanine amidase [bacterium]|jgi:N-acetylmuramoyl-L-alanine amidase|nr:N-acetylmuramoyl-L-alanine amidase [bacterium]
MRSGLWAALILALASGLRAAPLVLLDPGHGGSDAGVVAPDFRESDFALALALRIEPLLKARGCDVSLTRATDQTLSLTARVEMANALQPLAMVSLHVNAAFQPQAQGPRLFVPAEIKVDDPEAPLWEQAAGMHAAASRTLGICLARALGITGPRAVQTLKLGLFRGLSVPVCLVEVGFASHPSDLAALKDDAANQALAGKLADGIADYVLGPQREAAGAKTP